MAEKGELIRYGDLKRILHKNLIKEISEVAQLLGSAQGYARVLAHRQLLQFLCAFGLQDDFELAQPDLWANSEATKEEKQLIEKTRQQLLAVAESKDAGIEQQLHDAYKCLNPFSIPPDEDLKKIVLHTSGEDEENDEEGDEEDDEVSDIATSVDIHRSKMQDSAAGDGPD
jgi:hypothetical protein